jgi:hypothetical protein
MISAATLQALEERKLEYILGARERSTAVIGDVVLADVSTICQDMRTRGLSVPLLVVSDGVPGIIKAIETCFPRS